MEMNKSHGKEYYFGQVEFEKWIYKQRLYYVSWKDQNNYVCSSEITGEDEQVLFKIPNSIGGFILGRVFIFVNDIGIYIYFWLETDSAAVPFHIKLYSHEGRLRSGMKDKNVEYGSVYIDQNTVYYVTSTEVEKGGETLKKSKIKYFDFNTEEHYALYDKASSVMKLCAAGKYVFFKAEYCKMTKYGLVSTKGWMILDRFSNTVKCMSSFNPEILVDDTKTYLEHEEEYRKAQDQDREIIEIDPKKGVIWVRQYENGGVRTNPEFTEEYWIPVSLWKKKDENVFSKLHPWKTKFVAYRDREDLYSREYFDGFKHYYASQCHKFYAQDSTGKEYDWTPGNLHGCCDEFYIIQNVLFMDIDSNGEKIYQTKLEEPILYQGMSEKKRINLDKEKTTVDRMKMSEEKLSEAVRNLGNRGKCWHYIDKDADARIIWDGISKNCTVLKGSVVATESKQFATSAKGAKRLKDELEEQGILNNGIFVCDYECDKISTMINLLYGGSVNMKVKVNTDKFYSL